LNKQNFSDYHNYTCVADLVTRNMWVFFKSYVNKPQRVALHGAKTLKCARYKISGYCLSSLNTLKVPMVSLSKILYSHFLVLVGSRNRFELGLISRVAPVTFKLK